MPARCLFLVMLPILVLTMGCAGTRPLTAATPELLMPVVALNLPDSSVNTVIFSPDGRTLVTGDLDGEVLLWDCETWTKTSFLPARSTHKEAADIPYWGTLALSPDGNILVHAYGDNGEVTGLDLAGTELFAFTYGSRVYSVEISPDGKLLAVGGLNGNTLVFDLETRLPVADLASDHTWVSNLAFSPDGKVLLSNHRKPEHLFTMWDTTSWLGVTAFDLGPGIRAPHDMLFSLDGTQLVIANVFDPEIQFLDLASHEAIKTFPEHTQTSYQIALSPDGSLLASAGDDLTLRLWDMRTDTNFRTIRARNLVWAVAFSPDGTLLAFSVVGEGVQLWAVKQ